MRHLKVRSLIIGNDLPLTIIAGPCVMEGRDHALMMAEQLSILSKKMGFGLIYKTSFDSSYWITHV